MTVTRNYVTRTADSRAVTFPEYARLVWGAMGSWAYETWFRLNDECFDGELELAPIQFGIIAHGHALGLTSRENNMITLHKSLLTPSVSRDPDKTNDPWALAHSYGCEGARNRFDRERFTADVILHEMVHQAVFASGAEYDPHESHINPEWVAVVARISPLIGLSVRAEVPKRKRVDGKPQWAVPDGCLERLKLATWPHTSRPAGFYYTGGSRP
jgi:hypothetical protein